MIKTKKEDTRKIAIYSRKSKYTGKGESIENQIEMYKITKGSKLYPFYNSDHFMYITEEEKFIRLLKKEIMNYD